MRMNNGRMVTASKRFADLRQREIGQLACEKHGHLPSEGNRFADLMNKVIADIKNMGPSKKLVKAF